MKFKEKIYINYEDVLSMCKNLEYEVSKLKPDVVVGITRGGLVPALHLSHALDVPMETLRWQTRDTKHQEDNLFIRESINQGLTVVFVDDINDTGRTFSEIRQSYQGGMYVSLVEKTESGFVTDARSLRMDDPRWCVFPWEKD